jgi:hypothetical protein
MMVILAAAAFLLLAAILPDQANPSIERLSPVQALAGIVSSAVFAQNCTNRATFVEHVTIPDYTEIPPGASFRKYWSIRNTGGCRWDANYRLGFRSGARMGALLRQPIEGTVASNAELLAWVEFTAPSVPGVYRSTWQMQDANGVWFGPQFSVRIEVMEDTLPEELGMFPGGGLPAHLICDLVGPPRNSGPAVEVREESHHYAIACLYNFPVGTPVHLVLTAPNGASYGTDFVIEEVVAATDDQGEYTFTVAAQWLQWSLAALGGPWTLSVDAGGQRFMHPFNLSTAALTEPDGDYLVDVVHPNPLVDAECAFNATHTYRPGQEVTILGLRYPPHATVVLGLYYGQSPATLFHEQIVTTDERGVFQVPVTLADSASDGVYWIVARPQFNFGPADIYDGVTTALAQPGSACFEVKEAAISGTRTSSPYCTVEARNLNVRSGPSTLYEPPVGVVARGTFLKPVASGADGQWLRVQASGLYGWARFAPEYMSCNIEAASLPIEHIPLDPAPVETPAPPTVSVYEENFQGNDGTWQFLDTDDVRYSLAGGVLSIQVMAPSLMGWSLNERVFGDFLAEVDTVHAAGPTMVEYGLLFRYVDREHFYFYAITATGLYSLWKMEDGEWSILVDWTRSNALAQGEGAYNRLSLLADGNEFALFANGQELVRTTDSSFEHGQFALVAGTFNEDNGEIAFDNLFVWDLTP